jgi:hypothetical protein
VSDVQRSVGIREGCSDGVAFRFVHGMLD